MALTVINVTLDGAKVGFAPTPRSRRSDPMSCPFEVTTWSMATVAR